jgi:uncharacterized protein (DUF1501 family)
VGRDVPLMMSTLKGLTDRTATSSGMLAADRAVSAAVDVSNTLGGLVHPTVPAAGYGYGATGFDNRMSTLAWLIRSNLGLRVACLSYDESFDFHDDQLARQSDNLSNLSRTLCAFQAELEATGVADRVITLVWSEFGRRVEDNDSGGGGTDHGAGGTAMLIGTRVQPGIATEFPGIRTVDLDANGNLKVPVDFRQIYTTLLGEWMGTDPSAIIPAASSFAPAPLLAAA